MSYLVLTLVLIVFGALTGFSIGAPFLLLGLSLAVLAPVRRKPRAFWPPLAGIIGFTAGYIAVVPITCVTVYSTTTLAAGGAEMTSCRGLFGVNFTSIGTANPPLEPALMAGALAALFAAAFTFALLTWRSRRRPTV